MVRLKLKIGEKGQILIPKLFREKYGMREGENVTVEPREEGILLKGRPSKEEVLIYLRDHASKLESLNIRPFKLGDLKSTYQEIEYREDKSS
ncbi:MAG TPA: AbrB/MazE/SpoVT family DNA-binding domain-containing protein [Nitrososphaerales archaeon]|nr:AbrB/MazE/SpoVT family DNA-binding domain-containing protein [Nitrososphaerales archaeon]